MSRIALNFRTITNKNRLARGIWNLVWLFLFRPSPILFFGWRRILLRIFGAKIESGSCTYPSTRIWAPWNLTMRKNSCLAHYVDCYCVDKIELGERVTISQYSYLCTASHDYTKRSMPLVTAPIVVGNNAWVTADVFVGPGVRIGEGAVVAARSVVTRDVAPWTIVGGNPVQLMGRRSLTE